MNKEHHYIVPSLPSRHAGSPVPPASCAACLWRPGDPAAARRSTATSTRGGNLLLRFGPCLVTAAPRNDGLGSSRA